MATDVLVIGGGPAGTATAIQAAKQGLRVTLVEQRSFPRPRPGESLHPGVAPLLKELGIEPTFSEAGFLRYPGHWTEWGGERCFVPFGEDANGVWLGYQAWRADFDALLLEQAKRLGVEILQPCKPLQPLLEARRVVGVVTNEGTFSARCVVDAAGGSHWLARHLGLPVIHFSVPLTAYYGYAEGVCPELDEAPSLLAESQGWTWRARVRPNLYHWTRLRTTSDSPDRKAIPSEYRHLALKGFVHGADVTWRQVEQLAGPGYFLVGDAAGVLDPVSSHGVLRALMSGMMVGHLLGKLQNAPDTEENALRYYQNWLSTWFQTDRETIAQFYFDIGLKIVSPPCKKIATSVAP